MPPILVPIIGFLIGFFLIAHIGARFAQPRDPFYPDPNFNNLLIGATTSIAIYSLFITVLGMSGWFDKCYIITLILFHVVLVLFIIHVIRWRKIGKPKFDWSAWAPPDLPTKILLWLLILFQVGMFVNAIAPFINLDSETYHYLFIREWLENGRITVYPGNGYSYYPLALETSIASAYDMGIRFSPKGENLGPEAANLGFWFMQVLLMGWLISFCSRRGRVRVGYLLAIAVSGLFYWPVIAYSGDVDGGVALFALAGVFQYLEWLEWRTKPNEFPDKPDHRFYALLWLLRKIGFSQLALAGLFLGTALASKYSAIPIAGLVFLHALWILLTDRCNRKTNVHAFIGFVVFLLIPIIPWYFRNFQMTGNPIFPFMRDLLGGPEPAFADDIDTWTGWGLAVNLKNYILYPFKLAMFYTLKPPFEWIRVPYMYISWLFALAPFAGIFLFHRRIERIVAIWCFIFFTFAFTVMNVQTRYFLPFTILGLWLVCEWLETLSSARPATELKNDIPIKKYVWAKWVVFVIVLIPFLTQLDLVRNHMIVRWPYLSGQMTRSEYEESIWPSARIFDKANEVVGENETAVIFSLRSYRLEIPYTLPPEEIFALDATNPEILESLRESDLKYLLIDTRIRQSAVMIDWILRNGVIHGDVGGEEYLFDEEDYLGAMGFMDIGRDLAREVIRHQGGMRFDESGIWKWRIDLSRYGKPYEGGIFRFLAGVAELEVSGRISVIDRTDEWELYELNM